MITSYSFATNVMYEVGRFELRLQSVSEKATGHLHTEIGALSDDLVDLTWRVGTVEDELDEIFKTQNGILFRLYSFAMAHARADCHLTHL